MASSKTNFGKVQPAPSVMIIFGGTGNLTYKKLLPALYHLKAANLLPEKFKILAVARKKMSEPEYLAELLPMAEKYLRTKVDERTWQDFLKLIEFYNLEFTDEKGYKGIKKLLDNLENEWGVCFNRIFYLATPPSFFPVVFESLKKNGLNVGCDKHHNPARIVIEKPFGSDLNSARQLNKKLGEAFSEDQTYRIDHYLAKESVQNILAFRFGNEIFEPILNNQYVDHIEIAQAEEIGVEGRGQYYEEAGVIRDFVQNHILQLLAVTTMKEPKKFDAENIRREKVNALQDVRDIDPKDVDKFALRGQYGSGADGVISYRNEPQVSKDSVIETFVALKLFIDNPTWEGVPIYIRSGKRLEKRLAIISIHFKEAGHRLFGHLEKSLTPNILTFQLQPDEGISIRLVAKKPGLTLELADVDMEFCYASAFKEPLPEAYERLLLDILLGDQTLFPHQDEVIRSWEIVDNIVKGWKETAPPKFPNYKPFSWGPEEADLFIEKDGRKWLAHELKVCQLHHPTPR